MPSGLGFAADDEGDWREYHDADNDRTYYHNAALGVSKWTLPTKSTAEQSKAIAAAMPKVQAAQDVDPEDREGVPWCPACEAPVYESWEAHRKSTGHQFAINATVTKTKHYGLGPDNKGYQMLKRKGWSENDGLGKHNQGRLDPVPTTLKDGRRGIGAELKRPRVTHWPAVTTAKDIKAVAVAQDAHRGKMPVDPGPGNMTKAERLKAQKADKRKEKNIRKDLYTDDKALTGYESDPGAGGAYSGDPDFGAGSDDEYDPCP